MSFVTCILGWGLKLKGLKTKQNKGLRMGVLK
jgi:hypothetical protein